MEEIKLEEATYLGICKCCLRDGDFKSMWAEYSWEEEREVYGEMLKDSYNLDWQQPDESTEHIEQICETCIEKLRTAYYFKKQLLEAEQQLRNHFDNERKPMKYETNIIKDQVKEPVFDDDFEYEDVEFLEDEQEFFDSKLENNDQSINLSQSDEEYNQERRPGKRLKEEKKLDITKNYKQYLEYNIKKAVEAVRSKELTETEAALAFSVPKKILSDKILRSGRKLGQSVSEATPEPEDGEPNRKWPKRKKKSEITKNYRQYSEDDLRKAIEAVNNKELSQTEAALAFNIPKKTLSFKVRNSANKIENQHIQNSDSVFMSVQTCVPQCNSEEKNTGLESSTEFESELKSFYDEYSNYNYINADYGTVSESEEEQDDAEESIKERNIFTEDLIEDKNYDLACEVNDSLFENICECERQCHTLFSKEDVIRCRLTCQSFNSCCNHRTNHQQLLLTGALNCILNNNEAVSEENLSVKDTECSEIKYMFRGLRVCKDFFIFAYGVTRGRYDRISKYVQQFGVKLKQYNKYTASLQNTLTLEQRLIAIAFIKSYSEQNSLVLPGRFPYSNNHDLHIFPSRMTKEFVHRKFIDAAVRSRKTYVGLHSWYKIWDEFCPNYVIEKPGLDLCNVCQKTMSVFKSGIVDEEAKTKICVELIDHLENAQTERQYYKNVIAKAASKLSNNVLGPNIPCSFKGLLHISFDFAQQVHLPQISQRMGPIYFLNGYKVGLFGIAVEPLGKFILYVIPEACVVDKGANIVISMIHHFFENFSLGETSVICHADNYCSQNKNNYLLQYAVWRVMTSRHDSFQLSFLPEGHNKFAPDLYFGLFKKQFRKSKVYNIKEVCEVAVTACSKSNSVTTVMVGSESGNVVNVKSYDWVSFFTVAESTMLPQLKSFSHFKTNASAMGRLQCTTNCSGDGKYEHVVFRENCFGDSMPSEIKPQGLSIERQKYLYEKVRPFVDVTSQDILCPPPEMVRTYGSLIYDASIQSTHTRKQVFNKIRLDTPYQVPRRRPPTCSYCGTIGHRNHVVNGYYLCKKRKRDEQLNLSKAN